MRGYAAHVRVHLAPYLGQGLLAELSAAHVQAMFTAITRQHQAAGSPVTAPTLHRIRATLRAGLNAAIRAGLIAGNPAIRAELPRTRRPRAVVWTPEGVEHWQRRGRAIRTRHVRRLAARSCRHAINPALTAHEARYQIHDGASALVVADEASTPRLRDSGLRIIAVSEVTSPVPPAVPPPLSEDPGAPALLIYTSGTTGQPKGVILDHANISATARLVADWFEMTGDTRSLLVLPLFHVDGILVSVVSPLLAGGSAVIGQRFDAATFWAAVARERPSFFSAVPTIYTRLAGLPAGLPDRVRAAVRRAGD
jgi:non-ribosomal peptide synthetase component F